MQDISYTSKLTHAEDGKPLALDYYIVANDGEPGHYGVKIIEKNEQKCEYLCEALPKATIIQGDAADHDLLIEEGIQDTDAVVALTGMDEENIIMSLFAKAQGVDKIVAKVNEDSRA